MTFSTMPTAAASVSPRPLAMTVMTMKADLDEAVLEGDGDADA